MRLAIEDKKILGDKEFISFLNRPRFLIPATKNLGNVPLLKHVRRLTFDVSKKEGYGDMAAVGIYARRYFAHDLTPTLWYLEAGKDSGYEGVACVDDTGRAVALATLIYEKLHTLYHKEQKSIYSVAMGEIERDVTRWLNFILYMQDKEGGITNFILDFDGTKNTYLPNSIPSKNDIAWKARGICAFASGYKTFKKEEYKRAYIRSFMIENENKQYVALLITAALDMLAVEPDIVIHTKPLVAYVREWCEQILEYHDGFFHNRKVGSKLDPEVHTYAYHHMEAMVRAGVYLDDQRYFRAVDETIQTALIPNALAGFCETLPVGKPNTNVFGVSSIIAGIARMASVAKGGRFSLAHPYEYYVMLAYFYASWLYRENEAKAVMWYPDEGICLDNTAVYTNDDVSAGTACGAESAIEASYVQLYMNDLMGKSRYLIEE